MATEESFMVLDKYGISYMPKKNKVNYYTIDMAGHKRYFKTLKEAKQWSNWINEKMAIYPHIYKVEEKKLKEVV
jgi:hypothetical protein